LLTATSKDYFGVGRELKLVILGGGERSFGGLYIVEFGAGDFILESLNSTWLGNKGFLL
jgi:hypothetical protein